MVVVVVMVVMEAWGREEMGGLEKQARISFNGSANPSVGKWYLRCWWCHRPTLGIRYLLLES